MVSPRHRCFAFRRQVDAISTICFHDKNIKVGILQVASFRRDHDARLKGGHERANQGVHLPSSQDPVFAYGIKSGERVPMDAIMSNQFLKEFLSQQEMKQEQHQLAKKTYPRHAHQSIARTPIRGACARHLQALQDEEVSRCASAPQRATLTRRRGQLERGPSRLPRRTQPQEQRAVRP